jgi:glycerate dehydrogenase
MNIVLLDGYTMNPGDLNWDELKQIGNVEIFDRTSHEDVVSRSKDADILLTNKVLLTKEIIQQLPKLKYIGLLSTGTNVVDLQFARSKNIPVTNVPAYSTASVAQMTFAFILEICSRVGDHNESVKKGDWQNSVDFCYWKTPLIELEGRTIGLIGLGNIGKQVAKIAQSFDMKVLVNRKKQEPHTGIEYVSLDVLFKQSDIISLHCPLTPETESIINKSSIDKMKDGAIVINTGRGQLIDENALASALNNGKIAGAGLDVLCSEPPKNGSPLIGAKNCYITPHIAWASKAARERLYNTVIENIISFIKGKELNVVN